MPDPVVLVVDDDPDLRLLVRVTLEPLGYRVLEAADGAQALAHTREAPVAVALLDLDLAASNESGLDLCGQLRALDPAPTVIMVTGSMDDDDRAASARQGAAAFLTKPYSPIQLLDLIQDYLPA